MFFLLESLKGLTKLQTFTIDNNVFRLHYKVTVLMLALFSLIVTSTQFFGKPIACTKTGSNSAENDVVEPFCWTHNTYSIRDAFDKPVGEHGVIYPGVAQKKEDSDLVQHKYYQWVCFVLAFQAVLFYLPRYIWKSIEGEKVKGLVMGLNVPTLETEEIRKKQELLLKYLRTHRGQHWCYAFSYAFCEVCNFVNVLGQMFLMDTFLGGEFSRFGIRVLQFLNEDPRERTDPMVKVFPRLTFCLFRHYGPSSQIVPQDVLCVLSLNIINEKIYIFLWFWFVILLTVTAASLIYRAVVFVLPTVRSFLLKQRCSMADANDVEKLSSCLGLGDWFLLYQLSKNVENMHMAEILHVHAQNLDSEKRSWTPLCSEAGPYFKNVREDVV